MDMDELKNRHEQVINDALHKDTPRGVMWAIIVRLLRNAGYDFHQMDQAILDTWQDLYKNHFVKNTPPEFDPQVISWWGVRHERAVGYAVNIWGVDRETSWQVIDVSVRAELIPELMAEPEFKKWVDMKAREWAAMAAKKKMSS
jgi:hypothetical protein